MVPKLRTVRNTAGQIGPWLLLCGWFLLHLPFLTADPDTLIDIHTRGAWTDEGLYTAQARNLLNTGDAGLQESSTMIRGPLFFVVQLPFFLLFGQSLVVARMIVLGGALLGLAMFLQNRHTRLAGAFLILAGFTQFHLFNFSHYAMAEILSSSLVLIAILVMAKTLTADDREKPGMKGLPAASALLFAAYCLKIQFLYLALLLPLIILMWMVAGGRLHRPSVRAAFRQLLVACAFTALFLLIYLLAWYLPNREFYQYVMLRDVDARFHASLPDILGQSRFNFTELLFVPYLRPLIIAAGVAVTAGVAWLAVKPASWRPAERVLFSAGIVWLLLEVYKVSMTYMPHRYMLSAYVALALIIAPFLATLYRSGKALRIVAMVAALGLAGWQLHHSYDAWNRRTWELRQVNRYLKQYEWDGKVITGAWAGSVSWGTQAKTLPVWHGFLNDDKALSGRMIITESDQEESAHSMMTQGYDLQALADSSRRFPLWRYEVDLYWLPGSDSR